METKPGQIFLSYSRKDVGFVNKLYRELKGYGFSPWQDHRDIIGGRWLDAIKKAIKESSFFIICLSEHSVNQQTGVLVYEINEALEMMNYKRRSNIFILPIRLDDCQVPEELASFQWFDIFAPDGFDKLLRALRFGLKQLGIDNPFNLRSRPILNLSPADVGAMIKARNFYAGNYWNGSGIKHEYKIKIINGEKVVIDNTTGLMWQQSGSEKTLRHIKAIKYIAGLNEKRVAGLSDWRLPTLEEAMSLVEAKKSANGIFIADVFDNTQEWIWTADQNNVAEAWYVGFKIGHCYLQLIMHFGYVRAVHSGQSS